jgi:hypothetical protein
MVAEPLLGDGSVPLAQLHLVFAEVSGEQAETVLNF